MSELHIISQKLINDQHLDDITKSLSNAERERSEFSRWMGDDSINVIATESNTIFQHTANNNRNLEKLNQRRTAAQRLLRSFRSHNIDEFWAYSQNINLDEEYLGKLTRGISELAIRYEVEINEETDGEWIDLIENVKKDIEKKSKSIVVKLISALSRKFPELSPIEVKKGFNDPYIITDNTELHQYLNSLTELFNEIARIVPRDINVNLKNLYIKEVNNKYKECFSRLLNDLRSKLVLPNDPSFGSNDVEQIANIMNKIGARMKDFTNMKWEEVKVHELDLILINRKINKSNEMMSSGDVNFRIALYEFVRHCLVEYFFLIDCKILVPSLLEVDELKNQLKNIKIPERENNMSEKQWFRIIDQFEKKENEMHKALKAAKDKVIENVSILLKKVLNDSLKIISALILDIGRQDPFNYLNGYLDCCGLIKHLKSVENGYGFDIIYEFLENLKNTCFDQFSLFIQDQMTFEAYENSKNRRKGTLGILEPVEHYIPFLGRVVACLTRSILVYELNADSLVVKEITKCCEEKAINLLPFTIYPWLERYINDTTESERYKHMCKYLNYFYIYINMSSYSKNLPLHDFLTENSSFVRDSLKRANNYLDSYSQDLLQKNFGEVFEFVENLEFLRSQLTSEEIKCIPGFSNNDFCQFLKKYGNNVENGIYELKKKISKHTSGVDNERIINKIYDKVYQRLINVLHNLNTHGQICYPKVKVVPPVSDIEEMGNKVFMLKKNY
eukprot:TRINITY_DN439_c0_g1_i1.p1 TRINITY_DN439_c0_g1~~TRINITY_DN439_c0_g1_i1.p1  ORF type:complete len:744 (+),score=186.95 TRINITY_DN439_c0_g1_i1:35-2233(+)